MLSAVIHSEHSYPAVPLARQPVDQRFVHPGPLVVNTKLFSIYPLFLGAQTIPSPFPYEQWTKGQHVISQVCQFLRIGSGS